jgi:hypothetical protein
MKLHQILQNKNKNYIEKHKSANHHKNNKSEQDKKKGKEKIGS